MSIFSQPRKAVAEKRFRICDNMLRIPDCVFQISESDNATPIGYGPKLHGD